MNIKEFAKIIGVSPTTVSSALTGNGRVAASTREMVLSKMRELEFTPNLNARRLVSGRSFLVALSHLDRKAAADLFTMQVAREVVGPLKAFGYDLMLDLATDSDHEHALLRQLVRSSTIDGTILIGGRDIPIDLLGEIASSQHPCVVIGQSAIENIPHVGSVVIDFRLGLREAAEYLAEQGHRRISFIDSDLQDEVSVLFARELAELGVQIPGDYYVATGRGHEEGAEAVRKLMSRPVPPTAIVTRTDVLAVGALREARNMGLSIPGDVSIIGHDDLSLLALMEPDLTTIRINCAELAESAAAKLHQLLTDPVANAAPRFSETCLMVRKTAGPARA